MCVCAVSGFLRALQRTSLLGVRLCVRSQSSRSGSVRFCSSLRFLSRFASRRDSDMGESCADLGVITSVTSSLSDTWIGFSSGNAGADCIACVGCADASVCRVGARTNEREISSPEIQSEGAH